MQRRISKLIVTVSLLLAFVGTVAALINPNFSPVNLVEQSDLILLVKFDKVPEDGKAKAAVSKVLKGDNPDKQLVVDLMAGAYEAQGQAIARMINAGNREALVFIGLFEEDGGMGGMGEGEGATGLLQIGGKWVILEQFEEKVWDMQKIDPRMQGTWAGSTDMLLRAVKYCLSDEDADIPVRTNAEWAKHSVITSLKGKINLVRPVDLEGDGKLALLVASDDGDRLFAHDGKAFVDVSAKYGLKSVSKTALLLDGKLLGWDGKVITFAGEPLTKPGDLKNGCTSLAVLRPDKDHTTVVIGTSASPELLKIGADGGTRVKLVDGDFPGRDFGPGGVCLLADFDGDTLPDIVQLFEAGGLFYAGKPQGQFAAPVAARIALGRGASTAQVGDYDADGLLDIFTSSENANYLWHNLGKGQFVEMRGLSGEINYISKPGGIDGLTGDINNDGRQDIFIAYSAAAPHIFFNRGFRSFGHSHQLDLGEANAGPQFHEGEQSGCMADFNHDGAQDMVIALNNGAIWFFPRQVMDGNALAVTVGVDKSSVPVIVRGWLGDRELGAWNVTSGGTPAFFGLLDAGRITLKWRFPGGKEQSKAVVVIDKPVHVILSPQK